MSGCIEAPKGKRPASTCGDCGAVSTYHDTGATGEPIEPVITTAPPDSCRCRCHEVWRQIHGRLAS